MASNNLVLEGEQSWLVRFSVNGLKWRLERSLLGACRAYRKPERKERKSTGVDLIQPEIACLSSFN